MKQILKEFKIFILRGSVLDFAIGITIGAVFNSFVRSLVGDVIMPPVGFLIGGVDFGELFISLGPENYETLSEAREAGAATLNYGIFMNTLIIFLMTVIAVFFLVKVINAMREESEKELGTTAITRPCPFCLTDISRKASRCPNCTSEVEPITTKEESLKQN
ncbi:MAG: large conductance mechanosensitive channel protein MscL [Patescibacteria group bacterium]